LTRRSIASADPAEKSAMLRKCASTTLNSKLVAGEKEFFSKMVVDTVECLDPETLDARMIGVKKVAGGAMRDSFLVNGVAFKKTFSYAGFEQQPKAFDNPKILALNIELELKAERDNAEVRLSDPTQYQSIVDAEWNIIYAKLDKCVASGALVVLSRLAIGDLATQYFADRGIFCAGRVAEEDMARACKATGAAVQTTVNSLPADGSYLGTCARFEEKQVGGERYNIFSGCPKARTATIVLRGGAEQFIEEAERSLHDALQIVRRAMKNAAVVAGGGAIDMAVSRVLRDHARTLPGKAQLFIAAYARALEVIPRQLTDNAGFDATDVLNALRQRHAAPSQAGQRCGVDVVSGGVIDTYEAFIWEPALVKINALTAATEAACLVLSVDETVRNPRSEQPDGGPAMPGMGGRGGRGGGRGRGMRGRGRR
jgi:T-complex protein 1 subunit eta